MNTPTTRQLQVKLTKKEKEINQLIAENEYLKRQLIESRISSAKESELKNSCFFFLIKKDLFTEYIQWNNLNITSSIIKELK
jgi:hypothetical protein